MYSKKKIKRLQNQFTREINLIGPYHKAADNTSPQRAAFLSELAKSKTFVPTFKQNEKKFECSLRELVKKFNKFDYFTILVLGVFAGTVSYSAATNYKTPYKIINEHKTASVILFTTVGLLAGLGFGFGLSAAFKQDKQYMKTEQFYGRLAVRLFDSMREIHPDLDETLLKACNPEMARVIKALLIANMPEEDTKELYAIADKISNALKKISSKNEFSILKQCENDLKDAMAIVEHYLITDQQLYQVILSVYRGNIPAIFRLQNEEKTK